METYTEAGYNADEMENIFDTSARILRGWWTDHPTNPNDNLYICREWHKREQDNSNLHSAVRKAMRMSRPKNWQELLLQWPHGADADPTRIAYTQNERKGEADVQTVTSLGKYLRMHFVNLPDHAIRDLVAAHSATGCEFVHTTKEMIAHLHRGPRSCMVWDSYKDPDESGSDDTHPYTCYDPKFGWHMAVRVEGGQTVGRALCIDNEGGKYWVRSYKSTGGYSPSDEMLEAWLMEQGYNKRDGYGREKLLYIDTCNDFLAPYIDGCHQRVNVFRSQGYIQITYDDGEFECNNTDGTPSPSDGVQCDDCEEYFDDGDGYWVGWHEDKHICSSCCDNNYTYGYGVRGRQYYFDSDYARNIGGDWYHEDHLSDNDIVELANGEYLPMDDAILIGDDWYSTYDDDLCTPEDTKGEMKLKEDCWQCTESDHWYTDNTEYVEVDGEKYHPDSTIAQNCYNPDE
jgi:hypothetical protein